ncbi:MAG: Hsp20 family protein [Paracoccus sp. (in: a-proteobacteria)]|uniref:Hsp20 family protein n=1 Tax=Paracoccus sp. TaxID=267 RepID=UPI002E839825|nr:Hsp20 family protein [Pseudomonadota bacterium]
MTKISLGSHPYLLGFDQLERLVERAAKGAEGYPPYNIEHLPPDAFRITLAVAGFSDDDLAITTEDRQLVIRGQMPGADESRVFLHRGIASRAFQRSFVLADGVEVVSAGMENGLLHIDLRRTAPQQVVKTIPISRKEGIANE